MKNVRRSFQLVLFCLFMSICVGCQSRPNTEEYEIKNSNLRVDQFSLIEILGTGTYNDLKISPDGNTLALATSRGILLLYDFESTLDIQKIRLVPGPWIDHIAWAPNGKFIATEGKDNIVRVWQISDGEILGEMQHERGQVLSVAWMPDGSRIISSAWADNTLRVWNAETYSLEQEISYPCCKRDINVSSDGSKILMDVDEIIAYDTSTGLVDTSSPIDLHSFDPLAFVANGADWSPDNSELIIVGFGGFIIIDPVAGLIHHHQAKNEMLDEVAWEPDGPRIAILVHYLDTSSECQIEIWNRENNELIESISGTSCPIGLESRPVWTNDSKELIFIGANGHIEFLNTYDWSLNRKFESSSIQQASWASDGSRIVFLDHSPVIRDMQSMKENRLDFQDIIQLEWSPNSEQIVLCSESEVKIVDASSLGIVNNIGLYNDVSKTKDNCPYTEIWSPSGGKILTFGSRGDINFWDVHSGEKVASFDYFTAVVAKFGVEAASSSELNYLINPHSWSKDGKYLALTAEIHKGSDRYFIWIINTESGDLEAEFELLDLVGSGYGSVNDIAWSPDNLKIAVAEGDKIRIIDAQSGKNQATLDGLKSVYAISWSPTGSYIAIGDEDIVKIWELESMGIVHELYGHNSAVKQLVWSPDGYYLLSVGQDGVLSVWGTERNQ